MLGLTTLVRCVLPATQHSLWRSERLSWRVGLGFFRATISAIAAANRSHMHLGAAPEPFPAAKRLDKSGGSLHIQDTTCRTPRLLLISRSFARVVAKNRPTRRSPLSFANRSCQLRTLRPSRAKIPASSAEIDAFP
jgi:hypothetical protein